MKKDLLKKVLALALSATMALTPVVSYAGEEVITEEVVWEETAGDGQTYAESVEQEIEEASFEETATDDAYYAFEEEVREDNNIDFVNEEYADETVSEEDITEERVASEDVALFDEVVYDGVVEDSDVIGEQTVSEEVSLGSMSAYNIWVGDTQVTSENASNVDGEGKVSYDASTKTLTLNEYTHSGTVYEYKNGESAAIYSANDLNIVVTGTNISTITSTGHGIVTGGSLSISGTKLNIDASNAKYAILAKGSSASFSGIEMELGGNRGIVVNENNSTDSINITNSKIIFKSGMERSMQAWNGEGAASITITDSTVTGYGQVIIYATGGGPHSTDNGGSTEAQHAGDATCTITNSTVNLSASKGFGIESYYKDTTVTIDKSTVGITATTSANAAINVGARYGSGYSATVNIKNKSDVTLTGAQSGLNVWTWNNDYDGPMSSLVTVSDSKLDTTGYYYGISAYVYKKGNTVVEINNTSTVKATGTNYSGIEICSDADYDCVGNKSYIQKNSDVTLTGGYYSLDIDNSTKSKINEGSSTATITGGKLNCIGAVLVSGDSSDNDLIMSDVEASFTEGSSDSFSIGTDNLRVSSGTYIFLNAPDWSAYVTNGYITGGCYNIDPSDAVADNYAAIKILDTSASDYDEDHAFKVVPINQVIATVTDEEKAINTKYRTIAEAVTAGENGKHTITVLKNVSYTMKDTDVIKVNTASEGKLTLSSSTGAVIIKEKTENTITYIVGEAVAKINNKLYGDLQAAINDATGGDTITILKDIKINKSEITTGGLFTISKSLTINGNSKTIDINLQNGTQYAFYLLVEEDADIRLGISNMTLQTTGLQTAVMTNCDYATNVSLNNVNITSDGECIYSNGLSTVTATNCSFSHVIGQYTNSTDIYYSALIAGYMGTINATGCTVLSERHCASTFPSGGTINLINTDLTAGNGYHAVYAWNGKYSNLPAYNGDSTITYENGFVKGDIFTKLTNDGTGNSAPSVVIKDGFLSTNPENVDYVTIANNKAVIANMDIEKKAEYPYTIGEAVASVTDIKYKSFEEAVSAANQTNPITLLTDGISYSMGIGETLKVIKNGHEITVTDGKGTAIDPAGQEGEVYTYKYEEIKIDTNVEVTIDTNKDQKGVQIENVVLVNRLESNIKQEVKNEDKVGNTDYVIVELSFETQKDETEGIITFDITPIGTMKIYESEGAAETNPDSPKDTTAPFTIDNNQLRGSSFKFKLYIGDGFTVGSIVKVLHKSGSTVKGTYYLEVQSDANGKYVEVETDNFSTFSITQNVTVNIRNTNTKTYYSWMKTGVQGLNETSTTASSTSINVPTGATLTIRSEAISNSYNYNGATITKTVDGSTITLSNDSAVINADVTYMASATSKYSGGGGGTTYYKLTATAGTGGTVSPSGTNSYASGTTVSVTATADSGYTFTGWSGAASGTTNPARIKMNGNKTLTATFTKNTSSTATAFINEVDALPSSTAVTPANRDAVDKALKGYEALSADDKANVDVIAAKEKLDAINAAVTEKEKSAADAATEKINTLPEKIKAGDKDQIEAARKAYDDLTPAEKKMVDDKTVKKLTEAEEALVVAEADKQKADAVDKLIKALPEKPTLADKEKVEAADKAYKALTDAQKSYIPTADKEKLDAAVKAIEDAEAAKKAEDQAAADVVKKMIDDLPKVADVKPENKASVDAVQKQYDKLTEDQKELVPQAEKDKLAALQKALSNNDDDKKIAEQFTAAVNAVPGNKAGEGKGLLDAATAIYATMTDAQKALVTTDTMALYNEELAAFKKGRKFRSGDGYYKVLGNGDVTYLYPADKDVTGIVVPNQMKKGKFFFKVIKISTLAFDGCTKLKWVVIHRNIRVIGEYAFNETTSLTKINIKGSGFVSGKVIDAFGKAGKKDGESLTVKVPSAKVSSYDRLFKGEGKLNQKAKVVKAA